MKGNVIRLLVTCVSATLVALIAPNSALAASAERGKAAYIQNGCWQCHGTVGQGSIMTSGGKRLAPDPMPWEAFLSFVRSTNRTMPPYSETILSDGDLADIYAYLQSIPKPPDANSLPLLKP
jgi:ubiquinol-cytochrome c reductase cytochrome c subunit